MTPEQMAEFKKQHRVADGQEWDRFAGLDIDAGRARRPFFGSVPFAAPHRGACQRRHPGARRRCRSAGARRRASTQEAFGRIMGELARDEGELAARIITTSPDVTVSTSLGPWVSRRSVFNRAEHADVFKQERLASSQLWAESRRGQHVELGIAENNLFLLLAALGLSGPLFGQRLIPVGTLYDPFIARGLDALTYASYQDARFLLVATPSGISLAPEGGAHQSVATPLIGIGQPELLSFEPAYADELAEILRFAFDYLQSDDGSSVYLRLSTRTVEQPEREMTEELNGRDSRRRLLAARAGAGRGARAGRRRRDHARAARGSRCARRRPAGARGARDHLGRPAARGLARGAGAAGAGRDRQRRDRAAAGAARRAMPRWSPCSTATRRRSPGSAAPPAARSTRSASTASASRATFPICIALIRSMPRRSSIA